MTKYIATVEAKADSSKDTPAEQRQFVLEATGYKQAWIEARNKCRIGANVTLADETAFAMGAGLYTVRKVFTLDKPKRTRKELTVTKLVEAADAEGVKLPKGIMALINKLTGQEA